jgi:hypothetical protein
MRLQRIVTSSLVAACLAFTGFAGCGDTGEGGEGGASGSTATGGSTGLGGTTSSKGGATSSGNGGSTTGAGGVTTSGHGGSGPAGSGPAGSGPAGSGPGGAGGVVANGGNGPGGSGPGGSGPGGSGPGGKGPGGSGPGGAGPGGASKEDEGADCAIGTLPAASTAITKLPDPFTKIDGTKVMTKADWRCRREEIKKLEEKYVYGPKPAPPQSVTGTVSSTSISVMVMDGGKSASFTATVSIPSGATMPVPAIITYGSLSGIDSSWVSGEGVALINFNPTSVGAEGNGHGTNQKGAFYTLYSGGSATGLLTAWGWGVSRIIDVIERSGSTIIKPDAIGVTGCSRYGKGAFIAGVLDQRVALTMPVESGTAGVPIWRGIAKAEKGENGNPSQSLSSAYSEQPWFGDPFMPFLNDPTKNPIDTHELVAMIAPRGAFIMDNPHIGELSPKYGHVAALAGAEVYKALGAADAISYVSDVASGTHCSTRPEWQTPFKNAVERFLKKTGTAAGVIKANSGQSGNLADWRDWTTPTLQ